MALEETADPANILTAGSEEQVDGNALKSPLKSANLEVNKEEAVVGPVNTSTSLVLDSMVLPASCADSVEVPRLSAQLNGSPRISPVEILHESALHVEMANSNDDTGLIGKSFAFGLFLSIYHLFNRNKLSKCSSA